MAQGRICVSKFGYRGFSRNSPAAGTGNTLTVNADASGGELIVDLLDHTGQVISGYDRKHCIRGLGQTVSVTKYSGTPMALYRQTGRYAFVFIVIM